MKTLDKYIIRNLITSVVLCLAAIMLLRVAADLFFNMDEFAENGGSEKTFGMIITEIGTYYFFQSFVYFRQLGGVIIVVAAAFTLWRMNHTNELTAVLASGVSLNRVLLPVVICSMALNLLIIVDSELLIPPVKHKLIRKRDDVTGVSSFRVRVVVDEKKSAWYSGRFDPVQDRLDKPIIFLRNKQLAYTGHIAGPTAAYDASADGWVFTPAVPVSSKKKGGKEKVHAVMHIKNFKARAAPNTEAIYTHLDPEKIIAKARKDPKNKDVNWRLATAIQGIKIEDQTTGLTIRAGQLDLKVIEDKVTGTALRDASFIYKRADGEELARFQATEASYDHREHRWVLTDGALVYSSDLDPNELSLRQSGDWLEYMSTTELTRLLRLQKESLSDPEGAMLARYTRFADFFNNIILLLVTIPFILSRERNIKVSAGLALLMGGGTFAFIYLSRYLGFSPIVAAWLPIIIIGPISAVMVDSIKT
ncbi:MAG: LptF/LptG family permease [Phycisphaerae bacterium]|nr:LptF/LptG family permease [Phycisphaerae bacterium]